MPEDDRRTWERASAVLDQLGIGVLALDRSGRVAFHNQCAQSLFSPHLRVVRAVVTFADPANSLRFAERVGALRATDREAGPTVDPMVIVRTDSPSLLIKFVPATLGDGRRQDGLSGIVLLRQVEALTTIPNTRIQAAFNLTASEARLAAKLSGGAALKEVAEELQISVNTARVHLQTIFRKTNTNRQSQLVALLSSLA